MNIDAFESYLEELLSEYPLRGAEKNTESLKLAREVGSLVGDTFRITDETGEEIYTAPTQVTVLWDGSVAIGFAFRFSTERIGRHHLHRIEFSKGEFTAFSTPDPVSAYQVAVENVEEYDEDED